MGNHYLLTATQVAEKLTLSTRSIYHLAAKGLIPAPIRLSPRRLAWKAEDIQFWLDSRAPKLLEGSQS